MAAVIGLCIHNQRNEMGVPRAPDSVSSTTDHRSMHHADDPSIASNLKRSNDSDRIWGHGIGSLCAPGGAVGIGKLTEQ
jgi:hypothetical protein